jgi:hypothetical protein
MRDSLGWVVWSSILVCVVVLIVGSFSLGFEPWRLHQENRIIHASNSYITTQRTALVMLNEQYYAVHSRRVALANDPAMMEALQGQERGIVNRMKEIASLIPNDVPQDAAITIATGGSQ